MLWGEKNQFLQKSCLNSVLLEDLEQHNALKRREGYLLVLFFTGNFIFIESVFTEKGQKFDSKDTNGLLFFEVVIYR